LAPAEIRLNVEPTRRFDAIDITRRIAEQEGDLLLRYRKAFYCSFHTTAGYLEQPLWRRLHHQSDRLHQLFEAFRTLFPANGPYRHDQMHLRTELSAQQRQVEPHNGDSHLTFIGSGMRNCVTYLNRSDTPVYLIELDGVNAETRRRRSTAILAYDQEEVVDRSAVRVPTSRHPIESINLADPRLGLVEAVNESLARTGLEKGRVDICLGPEERDAGITVNEFETLLMQHDLVDVLRDPLRFAALKSRHILDDPLAVPRKTLGYARYDFVVVLNTLMEAFRLDESALERLVAKIMAVPARRFMRSKRVSFMASDDSGTGAAHLLRGTYQSPILVQWQPAARHAREIQISLVRFR
jgi:thiamine phosphate synthase YjbQ (UPF0047 family)